MTASEKNSLFETAKVTTIIWMFVLPAIASSLVGSIYNIVDQIFIGQKIGILGNAATNVAFPLVMLMVTFSMMIGVGASSNFSLEIGAGNAKRAAKTVGNSVVCMLVSGFLLMIFALSFLRPLMLLFGAREQTLEYAVTYTGVTSIGIPFYIVGTGMAMLIRADGSPKYAMTATISGAVLNTVLDPLFLFVFDMGIEGAALATILGQIISAVISVCWKGKTGDGVFPEPSGVFPTAADPLSADPLGNGWRSVCRAGCRRNVRNIVGWHCLAPYETDADIKKRMLQADHSLSTL